jgi:hypothetical protein
MIYRLASPTARSVTIYWAIKHEGPWRALRDFGASPEFRGDQWQPHPPPPQQPPPPDMLEATGLVPAPSPNTDNLRVMSLPAHVGHATLVETPGTYFSKSLPQPRQRYS